jgi:hypothetical protein
VPLYDGIDCPPTMTIATPEQEAELAALEKQIAELKAKESAELAAAEQKAKDLRAQMPRLRIMQDRPARRPTYILVRGDYRNPGEEVSPGIPAVLGALPGSGPANRLTLARWIVSEKNPLTARVTVNRWWALVFGNGLISTMDDFGSQGELASHPQLLDWLATEFVSSGWDVKAMLRLIVTSSTYRQSSIITPELAERDPHNRLLARGPRHRLPAEMIRDNALAISGLLDQRIGGASVFPYHPGGLWEEMAWADSPWKSWPQSTGSDLYRRGLYTFWKRSVLHPLLAVFDAPNRNLCEVYRSTTNTPLQAFSTLNEPSFVEAARAFAARTLAESSKEPDQWIDHAYHLALGRPANPSEQQTVRRLYAEAKKHFAERSGDASALVDVGESPVAERHDKIELAAWTVVAQVILNLDETMTKD